MDRVNLVKCKLCGKSYIGTFAKELLAAHMENCAKRIRQSIVIPKEWLTKEIGKNL